LKRLANGGYFQNNRQVILNSKWPSIPRFLQVIHSMTNLENLRLLEWDLTLTEDLARLFQSCPKLTELHMKLVKSQMLEMGEGLKNELRSGFQRLRLLELQWETYSWAVILEMFT
jgi:hypothetical protein